LKEDAFSISPLKEPLEAGGKDKHKDVEQTVKKDSKEKKKAV